MRWVVAVLVVVAVAVVGFYGFLPYGTPASWTGGETFVEIAPGTSTAGIARQLEQAGVLRSRYVLEAMKVVHGGTLKAGEYRFDHPATPGEVYERLRRGDVFTLTIVIPEGYNLFDIADVVAGAGFVGPGTSSPTRDGEAVMDGAPIVSSPNSSGITREEFLAAAREHTELIARWSPKATSLEGYLFPDTYRFSRHATALQILSAMVKRFGQQAGRLGLSEVPRSQNRDLGHPGDGADNPGSPSARNPGHPETADPSAAPQDDKSNRAQDDNPKNIAEVVTMASLVEKEVHIDAERAEVASVFENRLAAGMPLQTDPAVIYASLLRGTWTGVIHQSELHSDSAYNTYAHKGLPPGPICNPGMAALEAALHPAKTDYLYFVADAKGATRFSATLAGHNANVAAYRAARP
jgi:UPF0755 protein